MGAPKGVASQGEWSSMELHMASLFPLMPFVYDIKWGHFWVFGMASLPLGFPINSGGEVLSTLIPCSHTHAIDLSSFSLPPSEIVS